MTDPVVYRSTDPDVLASWAAACEALAEYVRQTQAVLDEAGLAGRPVFRHTGGRNYGQVGGIGCEDGIPDGWRQGSSGAYAVPALRTAAGRKIRDALEAVKFPGDPLRALPGMPADVLHGNRLLSPAVHLTGDVIWIQWSADPELAEMSLSAQSRPAVDHSLWERAKLSEYYAAKESAELPAGGSDGS